MKKTLRILAVLFVFVSLGSFAEAQESLEKLTFFKTGDECVAAFKSGEFRYYVPDQRNTKPLPPLAKGTPWPGCAHEVVRESKAGSPAWVVWAENTPALFNEKGMPSQDGRCHNKVDEFIPILAASITEAVKNEVAKIDLSKLKGDPGERGPRGLPGDNGQPGENFTPPENKGKGHKVRNIVMGVAVAGVGTYFLMKDDKASSTPRPKIRTDGAGFTFSFGY